MDEGKGRGTGDERRRIGFFTCKRFSGFLPPQERRSPRTWQGRGTGDERQEILDSYPLRTDSNKTDTSQSEVSLKIQREICFLKS